jgi:hypothetical protein
LKKTLLVISSLALFILAMAMMPAKYDPAMKFHTPEEIALFQQKFVPPLDSGQYFHPPAACQGCHGFDSLGLANIDANGNDVNLFDDWQTSMMAMSAKDPLWRAKVSHELLVNPAHANELQTLCTSCHAPMGHYTAQYHGQQYYTLADLTNDTLGLAGVACMACHSIGPDGLGSLFTGQIPYDTNHIAYGPFLTPMTGPMQLYVGLVPTYSDHVGEGRMCSPCHTLISNTVDLNGVPTGNTFVEQATFHEWENSSYPAAEITCQKCHMPQLTDPIQIANGYTGLPPRTPFNLHSFAGANSFMVNLIKSNKTSLNITASDADFDSSLSAIDRQLTLNTITLNTSVDSVTIDTAFISVQLLNKAGHKFPTGYPSRRAVLQMIVTNQNGDSIFRSGMFDSTQEVINIDNVFEPHYDVINNEAQVQIYEQVMGDVNGDRTTVLERSAIHLKDNRIPPLGFSTSHSTYDTCAIFGSALTDPDFNYSGASEGTGSDIVHYHVPLNGSVGILNVAASVYYQTLPPAFVNNLFTYQSPEIDSFHVFYDNADKLPLLITRDTVENINIPAGIENTANKLFAVINPTATIDGHISISGSELGGSAINIYSSSGKLIWSIIVRANDRQQYITLPSAQGIYYINIIKNDNKLTKKVIRL